MKHMTFTVSVPDDTISAYWSELTGGENLS